MTKSVPEDWENYLLDHEDWDFDVPLFLRASFARTESLTQLEYGNHPTRGWFVLSHELDSRLLWEQCEGSPRRTFQGGATEFESIVRILSAIRYHDAYYAHGFEAAAKDFAPVRHNKQLEKRLKRLFDLGAYCGRKNEILNRRYPAGTFVFKFDPELDQFLHDPFLWDKHVPPSIRAMFIHFEGNSQIGYGEHPTKGWFVILGNIGGVLVLDWAEWRNDKIHNKGNHFVCERLLSRLQYYARKEAPSLFFGSAIHAVFGRSHEELSLPLQDQLHQLYCAGREEGTVSVLQRF